MQVIRAALIYFALVFATGFALGMFRVPLLVPRLGVRTAELLEMPVMLVAIIFAARYVGRRHRLTVGGAVLSGCLALVLMLTAELSLALILQDQSLGDYVASRDPVSGSVYLVMLGVFAAMPYFNSAATKGPGSQ